LNLLRAAATVSGLTFLSRITGLARDTLLASAFGASRLTDAFWVAFRIPNLLRRLFGEGAFSQAFVPILGEYKARQGEEEAKRLIDGVATVLAWMVVVVSLIGIALAPVVVYALGSGLKQAQDPAGFEAAVTMTRIMFPYIVCMALVALAAGILNTWRRFAIPAFTPVLLNLSMIAGALWLRHWFDPPVYALAVAAMAGGILQLAIQVPALARHGLLPRLSFNPRSAWNEPGVKRVLRQMLPATLGVSVAQLSLIINTNIATYLPAGSVTWLQFSDRLMEFPTALLGVAMGTVLLPSLSKAGSENDTVRYNELLDWGLRITLLLALPAAVGLAMLSEALSATLFHYGRYSAADVAMTRMAVSAYAVGLLGLVSIKILAPGFYAKQDIRTPVKIALAVLVLTQLMNLVFVPMFRHAGLALSIGLGACINAVWLLIGLWRRGSYRPAAGWPLFILRVLCALAAMAGALYAANRGLDWIGLQAHPVRRVGWLAALVGGAAMVYFGCLFALGFRPRDFKKHA
jgi:putative peptidoglycan lipid II flippase